MVGATGFAPSGGPTAARCLKRSPRTKTEQREGFGRGDWIRTSGFSLPKRALYQAELRPELNLKYRTAAGDIVRMPQLMAVPVPSTPGTRSAS